MVTPRWLGRQRVRGIHARIAVPVGVTRPWYGPHQYVRKTLLFLFPYTRMVKKLEPGLTGEVTTRPLRTLWLACCLCYPAYWPPSEGGTSGGCKPMDWKTLLAYITGSVDQHLLLRNAYLVTENRILRNQIKGRVRLSDGERQALAELGQKLGTQALHEVAKIVKPDTMLGWHRQLVAQKFDGSHQRKAPGRPTINEEIEALVVRMAQENRSWGYDRIAGALAHLGYDISDQTMGNILKRRGFPPARGYLPKAPKKYISRHVQ